MSKQTGWLPGFSFWTFSAAAVGFSVASPAEASDVYLHCVTDNRPGKIGPVVYELRLQSDKGTAEVTQERPDKVMPARSWIGQLVMNANEAVVTEDHGTAVNGGSLGASTYRIDRQSLKLRLVHKYRGRAPVENTGSCRLEVLSPKNQF